MRRIFRAIYIKLRNYLGFSRGEVNGTLVLLFLIVMLLLIPIFYRHWVVFPATFPSERSAYLDSLVMTLPDASSPTALPRYVAQDSEPREVAHSELFAFNPNTATVRQFRALGLPKWLGERIDKYRKAGGRFRVKSDLKNIYNFPERDYSRLEAYIQLPTALPKPAAEMETRSPRAITTGDLVDRPPSLQPFDMNVADTTQWKRVFGIGSKLSSRIVRFRESLGGFVSKDQLQEVWGLDSLVLGRLDSLTFLAIDYTPQQIAVNLLPVDSLKQHPYLNYRQSKAIVAYREQHGALTPESMARIHLLRREDLARLLPYLDFETETSNESP